MKIFNTWPEMLKQTNYAENPTYQGDYIYANTGSVKADWETLTKVIEILSAFEEDSIEEYFYFQNFIRNQVDLVGIDILEDKLPDVYQIPIMNTKNFIVRGNLGSIVHGYHLVLPKKHILSMSSLTQEEIPDYIETINDMRKLYEEIYQKKPIVFEHGTNDISKPKASSVVHAHTHIVNHNYSAEQQIIDYLGLKEVSSIEEMLRIGQGKNYISYISPSDRYYIGSPQQEESQIMRKFIANDIGKPDEWDWRKYPHLENSFETAKQYVLYQQAKVK